MTVGYRVGVGCFETVAEATDVYFSSAAPSFFYDGSNFHMVRLAKMAGVWKAQDYYGSLGSAWTFYREGPVVAPSFIGCELSVSGGGAGVTECYPSAVTVAPCGAGFAPYLQVVPVPYDYAGGAALFAFGFSMVLGFWYISKNIGLVIEAVRRF